MSSFTECPYCTYGYDYDGDYEGFTQDSEQEFYCPKCNKKYVATVYWDLCITSERCLKPGEEE